MGLYLREQNHDSPQHFQLWSHRSAAHPCTPSSMAGPVEAEAPLSLAMAGEAMPLSLAEAPLSFEDFQEWLELGCGVRDKNTVSLLQLSMETGLSAGWRVASKVLICSKVKHFFEDICLCLMTCDLRRFAALSTAVCSIQYLHIRRIWKLF